MMFIQDLMIQNRLLIPFLIVPWVIGENITVGYYLIHPTPEDKPSFEKSFMWVRGY